MNDSAPPDAFALLEISRTAALDEDVLQDAYAKASRSTHPDHGGNEQDAAALNAAYQTLRSPEKRLKHLLELEVPEEAKTWRTVPLDDAMMTLFSLLGAALDGSGKYLEKKAATLSALAKALLAPEELSWRDTLENLGTQVSRHRTSLLASLPAWDSRLKSEPEVWKELSACQARLAYLSRWQTQIRERLLALM